MKIQSLAIRIQSKINGLTLRACLLVFIFFLLSAMIQFAPPASAAGASFYASPASGSYNQGGVVQVSILLNSGGQGINAVEGTVTWNNLQYSYVSTSGSIITNWASGGGSGPVGSASSVYFAGGMPGGGYNGTAGRILTVVFNATGTGPASVTVNGTQALVGDGTGSNAYCCSSGANYTINKPKPAVPLLTVQSSTHPDPGRRYTNRNVQLTWYSTTGNNGYTWAFDRNSGTEPGGNPTGTISTTYNDVADGLWYFHLKTSNESGGSTVHYAVRIDNGPPDEFSVTIDNEGSATNPTPKINFSANDGLAGIDHYTASIDGAAEFVINPGDHLPKTRPGEHTIVIKAFDRAGNIRESKAKFSIEGIMAPKIIRYTQEQIIQQPLHFIGQSDADDTIIVYLNDQEIERFVAKDKQVPKDKTEPADKEFKNGITWEYEYKTPLFPADYSFRFARTNIAGAESALTPIQKVTIIATARHIATWNEKYLVKLLLAIIFLLLLIIAYLLGKIHRHTVLRILRRQPAPEVDAAAGQSRAKRLWGVILKRKKDVDTPPESKSHRNKPAQLKQIKDPVPTPVENKIPDSDQHQNTA